MRFKSLTLVVLMALPGFALGADGEPLPIGFTQICSTEKSVGFARKSGEWSITRFKDTNYVLQKVGLASLASLLKGVDAIAGKMNCENLPISRTDPYQSFHFGC